MAEDTVAVEQAVAVAIQAAKSAAGEDWCRWAERWLSGEDRSRAEANYATGTSSGSQAMASMAATLYAAAEEEEDPGYHEFLLAAAERNARAA